MAFVLSENTQEQYPTLAAYLDGENSVDSVAIPNAEASDTLPPVLQPAFELEIIDAENEEFTQKINDACLFTILALYNKNDAIASLHSDVIDIAHTHSTIAMCATINGHLPILKLLHNKLEPDKLQQLIIEAGLLGIAAAYGQLEVLQYLVGLIKDKSLDITLLVGRENLIIAAKRGHKDIFVYLLEPKDLEKIENLLVLEDLVGGCFSLVIEAAANYHHTELLDYIVPRLGHGTSYLINFGAHNPALIDYLLSWDTHRTFDYMCLPSTTSYDTHLDRFVAQRIHTLQCRQREMKESFCLDTNELILCLKMIRYLIDRGMVFMQPARDQKERMRDIRALIDIPTVRENLHIPLYINGQLNALLHHANEMQHQRAIDLLLRAPNVYDAAKSSHPELVARATIAPPIVQMSVSSDAPAVSSTAPDGPKKGHKLE